MKKIGINYHKFYMNDYGIKSPIEFLDFLSLMKFKKIYVQIGVESSSYLNIKYAEKLKEVKDRYNFRILIHHPEKVDILDSNFLRAFRKTLTLARILQSENIVLHFPKTKTNQDEVIRKKLDSLNTIGLNICLENLPTGYYSDINNMLNFIDKNDEYYLTFDTGHLNVVLKGSLRKFVTVIRKLRDYSKKIKIVHVHLNDGTRDQHYPIYPDREGNLNQFYFFIKEAIREFSSTAIIVEESFPKTKSYLKNMINALDLIATIYRNGKVL